MTEIVRIENSISVTNLLNKIGVTKEGIKILKDKAELHLYYITDLRTPAANILKQEALSIGADLAVSKDTITCKDEHTDALLIASAKQVKILVRKAQVQPFGLNVLAKQLNKLSKQDLDYKKTHYNLTLQNTILKQCNSMLEHISGKQLPEELKVEDINLLDFLAPTKTNDKFYLELIKRLENIMWYIKEL